LLQMPYLVWRDQLGYLEINYFSLFVSLHCFYMDTVFIKLKMNAAKRDHLHLQTFLVV
jgi:hypothetical protein